MIKNHYNAFTISVVSLVLAVSVFFGFKKNGFYIDEYYLYTMANGSQLGVAISSGEWNDTSDYMKQLVSEPGENFHFKQVYETESSNVHPPLYYYLLHFMSSIFSGRFSKWIGLGLNLLILIPTLIIARKMAWELSGHSEAITLLTVFLFGLSPATISMVVLVRMYLLVGHFTLLYAYLHIADLKRGELSYKRFIIPLMVTGFLGFLTHYFFVVIMFFITFVYAFYMLVFCRRIKDTMIYCTAALFSLVLTYFAWPYSYYHIFKGYRGKGAVSQLRDSSHMWDRLFTELNWLDRMVFSFTFIAFAIVLIYGSVLLIVYCVKQHRRGSRNVIKSLSVSAKGVILTGIASILNFFVLSQISLMDGIMSCRHLFTSYVLFLVLLPSGLYIVLKQQKWLSEDAALIVSSVAMSIVAIFGHIEHNVLFLFENEYIVKEYVENHSNIKMVMFQNDDGNYDSRIQELILFPEVYYASVSDLDTAKDPVLSSEDELLVYVSRAADPEECFAVIYDQNPNITQSELLMECYDFFDVYLLK